MKTHIFAGLTLVTCLAQAKVFTCIETEKSKNENPYDGVISFELENNNKHMKLTVKDTKSGKVSHSEADLDMSYTIKDDYKDGEFNLDEDFNRKLEFRYVSSDSTLAGSDAESIVFIQRSLLAGRPGKLSLSSGQANDGESGDPWLWFRGSEFNCK